MGRDRQKNAPSALRDAEMHLRASLRPNGCVDEDDWDYPDKEKAELRRWAKTQKLILPTDFEMPPESKSREHDVIYDEGSGLWVKYTKPNAAGYAIEWDAEDHPYMISALPIEYFQRLRLQNTLFGDNIQLKGLWQDIHRSWRIVTTQPHVKGRHPTSEELVEAFVALGFEKLPWQGIGYEDSLAFRKDGYDVWDVRPANVILDIRTGLPLPFDVIIRPVP